MESSGLPSFFTFFIPTSLAPPPKTHFSFSLINRNPNFSETIRCFSTKKRPRTGSGSYWDSTSNTETSWTDRFKFDLGDDPIEDNEDGDDFDTRFGRRRRRNWWSDGNNGSSEMGEKSSGIFEEAIDNIWIIKVFSAFGWLLPAIIVSTLLATGPKAFLMALVLPLGQSVVSFALDKLFGKINNTSKSRSRTKRKPFSRATRNSTMTEEEEEISKSGDGYQSWVGTDNGAYVGKKAKEDKTTFGGWDELDVRGKSADNGAQKRATRKPGGSHRVEMKGKLSKRGRNKSTPLLLRLLIAVFPFLGSWTKVL